MTEYELLKGKRILLVDDEVDVLDTLEDLLSMCETVKAVSFEEAKTYLETQYFDMTILDIMGVEGYQLLEIATQRKVTAVMLTAHALSPENAARSYKEGAASYIPKEELSQIAEYLIDVLKAKEKGKNPWGSWQERLPSSYFEKRWGAAWRDTDQEFWQTFKAGLKSRSKKS